MKYNPLKDEIVRRVAPSKARFYVESKGWIRVKGTPESVAVYHHPDLEGEELVIPDQSYGDFTLRVSDAVNRIAESESRDPNSILSDMLLSSPADIVEVRAVERETEDGTIPIESGMKFVRGARDLLKASIHAAFTSLDVPSDRLEPMTDDYLKSCRMAPSERGSYIVRFMCPSGILPSVQTSLTSPIPGPSITRLVTTTLIERVNSTITLAVGGLDNNASLPEPERRIYLDFCEAISELELKDEDATVDLSVSWAGKRPYAIKLPDRVRMQRSHFAAIKLLRRALLEEPAEEWMTFTGMITGLRDVIELVSPDDIKYLEIEFVYTGKERTQKAKVRLPLEEREKVFRAAHNRLNISVEGRPGEGERKTWIEDPKNFRILE